MDAVKIQALRKLVQNSLLLLPGERAFWLGKLAAMTEEQLSELADILNEAAKVDWEKELPNYSRTMDKAIALSQRTEATLRALSPTSHG